MTRSTVAGRRQPRTADRTADRTAHRAGARTAATTVAPRRRSWRHAAASVLGGVLVAAALPPWGAWPLAFIGVAVYQLAVAGEPTRRQRATRGALFGAGFLIPGMIWMWFLTAPGYLAACAVFAGYHAAAGAVTPNGRWSVIARPAAHTLAEALRFCFPFGGVPLASFAIGQAGGPLLPVARLGGALLLTWLVLQVGVAIGALLAGLRRDRLFHDRTDGGARGARPRRRPGLVAPVALVAALAVVGLAGVAPDGRSGQAEPAKRVTIVQGGGPQGTHAQDGDDGQAAAVFARHLDATTTILPGTTDLVVWPENVVVAEPFAGSEQLAEIAAQAMRLGVPVTVGVTEDLPDNRFVNAQVVVAPDGAVTSRYEKVRRVPFGEYMPMRDLLTAIGAPTNLVPRNAVPGKGPAVLDLPDGTRVAVVISWEVFFGGRANEGVERGGTFIINPTNGSSYTWTVLQSQQVASSRLRAMEQGRWVVQVSPTGFSAFVTPGGDVLDRTSVSETKVLTRAVEQATGRTWYSRLGNIPFVVLAALALAAAAALAGTDRRRCVTRATTVTPAGCVTPPR